MANSSPYVMNCVQNLSMAAAVNSPLQIPSMTNGTSPPRRRTRVLGSDGD